MASISSQRLARGDQILFKKRTVLPNVNAGRKLILETYFPFCRAWLERTVNSSASLEQATSHRDCPRHIACITAQTKASLPFKAGFEAAQMDNSTERTQEMHCTEEETLTRVGKHHFSSDYLHGHRSEM